MKFMFHSPVDLFAILTHLDQPGCVPVPLDRLRKDHLHEVGLCVDEEGDDFELIAELIHPPTPVLRRMLSAGTLKSGWSTIMKGRRVERAWIYEIATGPTGNGTAEQKEIPQKGITV